MRVCPRCASTSVETTTVGYYGLDMNKATCRGPGCGWVGRAHEMATTAAGAEAWERRATEAEAKLEALVKACAKLVDMTNDGLTRADLMVGDKDPIAPAFYREKADRWRREAWNVRKAVEAARGKR